MTHTQRGKRRGGKLRKPAREKNHTVEVLTNAAMSNEYEPEPTYVAVREGRAYRCVPVTPTSRLCGACIFDGLRTSPRGKAEEPIADCSLEPNARSCPRCLAEILTWPVAGILTMSPLSPDERHTEKPRDMETKAAWTHRHEVRSRLRQMKKLQAGELKPRRPAVNQNWSKTGEADSPWWVGDLEEVG